MTPMFAQYFSIKENHPNSILFFRMGDFYEMFFEDAKIASAELGLALTSRYVSKKEDQKAAMCGIPFHSADTYISRLIKKGYSIAIAEQTEVPEPGKTLVNRQVTRVITPGTITDENQLDNTKNNWIMAIYQDKAGFGIATTDITTGDFFVTEIEKDQDRKIIDEIARVSPSEIIINKYFAYSLEIQNIFNIKPTLFVERAFEYTNASQTLIDQFGDFLRFKINNHGVCSAGALLEYLFNTQFTKLNHITNIKNHTEKNIMQLDISSRSNLELVRTQRTGEKKGSLLWVLDKTKTSMGARKLRNWVEEPLINSSQINARLDAVSYFTENPIICSEIRDILSGVRDIERIMSKIIVKRVIVPDLLNLKNSIDCFPDIVNLIKSSEYPMLKKISDIDILLDISDLLEQRISQEENEIIKIGVSEDLDSYREAKQKGTSWLLELEEKERKETGIKNLKIKFSRNFGYCIEISNAANVQAPDRYIRRQTLTNAERYITQELKEIEEKILSADDNIKYIENQLLTEIINIISEQVERVLDTSTKIAVLDAITSLAEVASKNNYVKPIINNEKIINIEEGRHPVIEQLVQSFVTNHCVLDDDQRIYVLTGPNMAGKSTYMRGIALITLMAQIGSFVPANSATIGVVDRIFTRIGASDDLATGQSTFMVEMNEVANILNNATEKSLLILDEIGRGTSTHDGLCIAWAILEHIANDTGAKTLFATHYHELAQIEGRIAGVFNYSLPIEEINGELVFLRKVVPGAVNKSYGIQVAKLSGIPIKVINRASDIMKKVEHIDLARGQYKEKNSKQKTDEKQISIF